MKTIINIGFCHGGGVKPSSNATFRECIRIFFESIKKKCRELSLVNSELTTNKQNLSSRINAVHCGILKKIKRYRNKCGMTHFVKCVAFTLAETLVVMGIIGVVAALTIPNLNQSTGDREKVAKLKKVYSNLEDAFGRATAVYGPIDEWFINLPEDISENQRLADRMTEFMKISKNCGTGSGCFADGEYPELDGDSGEEPNDWDEEPKILLADGTALDFFISNKNCSTNNGATSDSPAAKSCGVIYVDIDGPKGPNTMNKDYFKFHVTSTGIYPYGGKNTNNGKDNDMLKRLCFVDGWSCTGWVIETGNMDYLKANEGVCPNGTELSWENTSCK